MVPRQISETVRPVVPSRRCFMLNVSFERRVPGVRGKPKQMRLNCSCSGDAVVVGGGNGLSSRYAHGDGLSCSTPKLHVIKLAVPLLLASRAHSVRAEGAPELTEDSDQLGGVVVTGRAENLAGVADSATQGTVGNAELVRRPILRPGEVLEAVPGVIVTQHASGGEANQYFLRGFNLDHGGDFATSVDGVPINLGSHAHGQGYTDINWLIPKLVEGVEYRKGPYFADVGDFGSVGAANIKYF